MSLFEVSDTRWYPGNDGDVETYLDMFGAGANATPFGSLHNLCVIVTPRDGVHIEEQNEAIHGAVLRISDTLANTTRDLKPAAVEVSDLTDIDPALPRIAYVMALRSPEHYSASLNAHWTGIYGMTRLTTPWLLNPNELFDGAVSGRNSWELANNPVAWGLSQRHGKDLNFVGCITIRTRWSSQREKFITAQQVASLCQSIRANGAVVTWDSGGNDFMEVIRTIEACENVGVKTVFLTQEESPSSGGPPLLEPLPEADAIVTTGFHGPAGGAAAEIPAPGRVIGRRMLQRVDPVSNQYVEIDTAGPLTANAWADRYGFMCASAFEH
jgi:glycine reductase